MPYIPNTDDDQRRMLARIGVSTVEDLLTPIPRELRLDRPLDIPSLSEMELLSEIEAMSSEGGDGLISFAGGGVYDHFIPAAVSAIVSRPEFVTAYTPYQPEVSQGTLQVIYEFQTHICRLTGMDAANASLYDGASAAAEAVILAVKATRRNKVLISEAVCPMFREVTRTYLTGRGIELVIVPTKDGVTDIDRLKTVIDNKTAAVLMAQPNFFGFLEEIETVEGMIHKAGGLLIMAVDPIAQALLKTPGDYGADIVVGEGQPLGLPMSFGGPLLGFFATRKKLVRSMPGRVAGRTTDIDGKPGFVLVLQTREQHIRREKATSNICTNQALCATIATVYFSLLGKSGLRQVALLSAEKAQTAAMAISKIDGFKVMGDQSFVREFAVRTPIPAADIIEGLAKHGILAGVDAGRWYADHANCLIVALTEKRTTTQIDRFINGLKEFSVSGVLS
ncbi:MAG: aminomethyl-transferring glycine dehydrogenase subunit GcvPA [candidate division Zixibacteria bacterium]|nr:aminomethyl-transferring glycine dehydrogenase subunit GcvPA [candidate division Zixibacteria bacterium]